MSMFEHIEFQSIPCFCLLTVKALNSEVKWSSCHSLHPLCPLFPTSTSHANVQLLTFTITKGQGQDSPSAWKYFVDSIWNHSGLKSSSRCLLNVQPTAIDFLSCRTSFSLPNCCRFSECAGQASSGLVAGTQGVFSQLGLRGCATLDSKWFIIQRRTSK